MKLLEKIRTYFIQHEQSKYIVGTIFLAILIWQPLSFPSKPANSRGETEKVPNPNVLRADEIKKLSALMTSNGKHPYKMLPLPAPTETKVAKPSNGRCNYNGQDYLAGDIVKTSQGWIRCTPIIIFNTERSENMPGSSAWTAVQ